MKDKGQRIKVKGKTRHNKFSKLYKLYEPDKRVLDRKTLRRKDTMTL